ncbi:hypothetical protein A5731_08185 [Mycolicibacterium conceptionense]|uniref:Toxin YqcG C-terminal domain-containing protein n=1 Tax=Mycolicibacterium conceptionense TaxID=451644 RepID=A0A1A1Y5L5_9MYCO|nr:GH-E family nuclease [Mycolicibacterium conceptionense]OBF06970.1 hypothetical protein A5731_08185 [Mycolicibacterium conceptionense]OBF26613.1 hypothetical protein A5726_05440 [Mycolicibacterium conceptionense]OBH94630.1 hypothetical protein A5716_23865 [Mycolicibacterium conceptionense]
MSPAAAPAPIPTRSEIEAWSTSHLTEAASTWRTAATTSEGAFDQHRQNVSSPAGTTWEGDAKDAALDRVTADLAVVGRQGGVLREAADLAENGSHDIKAAKDKAVEAITAAENDDFRVGEDLSVTDTRRYDITTIVDRNRAAVEHAEDIRWAAAQLGAADKLVGDRLEAKAADLERIRFEGEGEGRSGHVYLADHEADGTDPNHPAVGAPNDGSGPMSDAQVAAALNDLVNGQDLSAAEAAQLENVLREGLVVASSRGLNANDAYAQAEDAAANFMSKLRRPYIRKSTRLGVFRDSLRTPEGDFLSDISGDVIPAMRDAAGDLIWVDETTGRRVAEGTPGAMTVPDPEKFHLGHQFGEENWRILRQAMEEGWTQQEVNDFINHSEHFRLETPAENSGHANEDHSPFSRNPAWTPDRIVEGANTAAGSTSAPSISLPPNLPNVLNHPPVALPSFDGSHHSPVPGLPPVAPTPPLPPWLTGAGGGEYTHNPLGGPIGVNIDVPPAPAPAAPSPGWTPPDISVHMPDVNITPEEAGKGAGVVAGIGAFLALLGKFAGELVYPLK